MRGRERRDRLVADVLVDQVGGPPERVDVDARPEAEARRAPSASASPEARWRTSATGYTAQAIRSTPARAASIAAASARAARALAVEADRQAARLADRLDELADAVRLERAGRVVDQHAGGTELRQAPRLRDERLGLAGRAGAVDEARVELAPGAR